ncbi:isoamyl acetate-hydrolyzing esterase 1 homolog [Ptychodera flava]|uniref:isoamyl acetate-hydrolyzing esterase 1 homolog n=1 Tax=Ptychodera flava TaxID=63121 RepID=UPI00396A269B
MFCRWPKVVLFGDSLTERSFDDGQWGAILQNKLQRRCDVVNRGYGGYNTTWGRVLLPGIMGKEICNQVDIAAIVIFLGANDSTSPGEDLYVPIELYKENLQAMVNYLKTVNVTPDKIIFVSPPPVNETALSTCCRGKWKTDEQAAEYTQVCCDVAKDNGAECLNLYRAIHDEENWTQYMHSDGVHLSTAGGQFLESQLWPMVEKKAEEFNTKFPSWEDFEKYEPRPREIISPKMIKQLTIEDPDELEES